MLGTVAATRTVSLGVGEQAGGERNRERARPAARRVRRLAATHARDKPPALPKVPKSAGAPALSPNGQAPVQRVVYQRPPPIVVVKHTAARDDDGSEQADGGGGGND